MIKTDTVFILGAGASSPYGYPTGFELVQEIKIFLKNFPFDPREIPKDKLEIHKFFKQLVNPLSELSNFYDALLRTATYSIDKFLENRPDYLELGKLLIAYMLKQKENEYRLFTELKEKNWYAELFNRIDANIENIFENRISFITFNYDRSLEFFLYSMLKNRTTKKEKDVLKAFNAIPIVHIYGTLGCFPWSNSNNGISYSYKFSSDDIKMMATNIQIMNNERETDELRNAQKLLSNAKNIYFLGFGYDFINMKRLKILKYARKKNINGTAKGIPPTQRKEIEGYFHFDIQHDQRKNATVYTKIDNRSIILANEDEGIMGFLNRYVDFYMKTTP